MPRTTVVTEKLLSGVSKEARTRGPSPEKTAQTRSGIVTAALAEFLEKGFAEATMESVARRAGVAKGTPYRYFPTKEALFSGVVEQKIAGAFIDFDASKREPGESVEAFLRRSILAAMEDIERKGRAAIARLVVVEGVRFPALIEIYRTQMMDPLLKRLKLLAGRGARSGRTTKRPSGPSPAPLYCADLDGHRQQSDSGQGQSSRHSGAAQGPTRSRFPEGICNE